jgi:hypothetical protein
MTTTAPLPPVQECSAEACGYNADHACHAGAITVAGDHAHCGTFVEIGFRAGLERTGQVGACHRSECRHNDSLECTASAVRVGRSADAADCLTYSPR